MKALFDNLAWEASLGMDHEDPLYPVTNIRHAFLKKACRSTENSDTIEMSFSVDQSIDSVYVGYTNANSIHVVLYNASYTLLYDTYVPIDTLAVDFTLVSGVRYVHFIISALTDIYIGAIGIGVAYEMPNPIHDWVPDFEDNSNESISADGQYLKNYVPPLAKYEMNFVVKGISEFIEIRALILSIERPIFIDLFEKMREIINPIYGVMSMKPQSKSYNTFRFSLTITEAR